MNTFQNTAVCIGRGVPAGDLLIDNLYVSPSGSIIIAEAEQGRLPDYAAALSGWTASDLDRICEDYTYATRGQAFRVIDLMAHAGLLSFKDGPGLYERMGQTLAGGSCVVLLSDDAVAGIRKKPTRRELTYKFAEAGGYSPDTVVELLQEIEGLSGFSVSTAPGELHVDFSDAMQRITVLRLRVSDAAVYILPGQIQDSFTAIGTPQAASDFIARFRALEQAGEIVEHGSDLIEAVKRLGRSRSQI